jgi:hypothetical protein
LDRPPALLQRRARRRLLGLGGWAGLSGLYFVSVVTRITARARPLRASRAGWCGFERLGLRRSCRSARTVTLADRRKP